MVPIGELRKSRSSVMNMGSKCRVSHSFRKTEFISEPDLLNCSAAI